MWQMLSLFFSNARRRITSRFKLARSRRFPVGCRGGREDGMRIGLRIFRLRLRHRPRRILSDCSSRRTGIDDLGDSDCEQDEAGDDYRSNQRIAAKHARKKEADQLQGNEAAADDGQPNAFGHLPLPFDLERVRHRRRIVSRLRQPSGQGLRNCGEIRSADSAEFFSFTLIRSTFRTKHRDLSENHSRSRGNQGRHAGLPLR